MNEDAQSSEQMKSSSAADMDSKFKFDLPAFKIMLHFLHLDLFQMLMRVQGDTLEEQRSAEPTPEPLSANRDSPSSKGSSGGSWQRETPSPHKSELLHRPGSRTKRRVFGYDDVDRVNVTSPLQYQHSQSDSAASLNLSSNSPVPSSPATLSQEYEHKDGSRPGSRNSMSSNPQNDTGQYMSELRNKNVSPSLDKVKVRHELAQWAAKGKGGGENSVNGKVSLPPRSSSVAMVNRYQQQPRSHSPPPALIRTDHQRPIEVNKGNSHSPTPPVGISPPSSTIGYQSSLDSWVMHADSRAVPDLPHSPPVRYQSEAPSLADRQTNRTRQPIYQQQTTQQGWKMQAQNIPPAAHQMGAAIPARRFSQGRPQVTDDRRLLMEGDRLLRRELEEVRAAEHHQHYHRPSPGGIATQVLPQHRQLPLSPSNSASSIISNTSMSSAISQHRQQNHYVSIPGGNVHETRV